MVELIKKAVFEMKKIFLPILIIFILLALSSCKKSEPLSADVSLSPSPAADETKTETENETENETEGYIFVLKNNCQNDLYSIEFVENGKEPLALDGVLPSGNEVKVQKSGKCAIKAKILNSDGSYSAISFGEADLSSGKTVTLEENGAKFFISYE